MRRTFNDIHMITWRPVGNKKENHGWTRREPKIIALQSRGYPHEAHLLPEIQSKRSTSNRIIHITSRSCAKIASHTKK
ncbi:predicted protein [Botrytis cinerea T4]|uniref:Uncharacterized protein n=1 Tax=Botryotinia fuckeliana (strain T4) TaxID=999810 RepID=G2YDA9_BOTF4|nr:predicted protein [Botrytis cinerea T4]